MIISEDETNAKYQIRAYQPGMITVNNIVYNQSIIITSNQLITDWTPQSMQQLTNQDISLILSLQPEIVLLGTGKTFIVPSKQILAIFYDKNIGIEYMDTGAACRTFSALSAEGRNVAAALLIE